MNASGMRVLGDLDLGSPEFGAVTWLRPDRLLALLDGDSPSIAVVDPARRSVVRQVPLSRAPSRVERLPDGLALLPGIEGSFEPAVVAVADAEGAVRTVTLDRISIGRVTSDEGKIEQRSPGFTVDRATHRAFVVGADFTVAEVDLDTLAVAHHGGSARSLAKYLSGPTREAVWLGNGLLAVTGTDYTGDETKGDPAGLRLIDTRDWSSRLVDPQIGHMWRGTNGMLFAAPSASEASQYDAYGAGGTTRYRLRLTAGQSLRVAGAYGYVCSLRQDRVLRVLDSNNGAALRVRLASPRPACPNLLHMQAF